MIELGVTNSDFRTYAPLLNLEEAVINSLLPPAIAWVKAQFATYSTINSLDGDALANAKNAVCQKVICELASAPIGSSSGVVIKKRIGDESLEVQPLSSSLDKVTCDAKLWEHLYSAGLPRPSRVFVGVVR